MPVLPEPHHYLLDITTPSTYVFLGVGFIICFGIIISRKSLTHISITILKPENLEKDSSSDLTIKPLALASPYLIISALSIGFEPKLRCYM